jgi:hypothetical protein
MLYREHLAMNSYYRPADDKTKSWSYNRYGDGGLSILIGCCLFIFGF